VTVVLPIDPAVIGGIVVLLILAAMVVEIWDMNVDIRASHLIPLLRRQVVVSTIRSLLQEVVVVVL
jgi:hypothetical protein